MKKLLLLMCICALFTACNKAPKEEVKAMEKEPKEISESTEETTEPYTIDDKISNLCEAIEFGRVEVVKRLLAEGADANENSCLYGRRITTTTTDVNDMSPAIERYDTPLIAAAQMSHVKKGQVEIVEMLLAAGAKVNMPGQMDETALLVAAADGNVEVVKLLLNAKADTNIKNREGETAFMVAAKNGHLEVVKLLLDAKADVNAKNPHGYTALMKAAQHTAITEEEFAARVAGEQAEYDKKAVKKNYAEIVKLLIAAGANVNEKTEESHTALMDAVKGENVEMTKVLLEAGADVNAKDKKGRSALTWACANKSVEMANMLVAAGAEDSLYSAALRGDTKAVKSFIAKGSNVNKRWGDTALTFAAAAGHTEVVKVLLAAGADVNLADTQGKTPLWYASYNPHSEVVQILLNAGADVNKRTKDGETALIYAACNGKTENIKLLLTKGAKVNDANNDGTTALMCAAWYGYPETVKSLLKNKANINQVSTSGHTALMAAVRNEQTEVVKVLAAAGADLNIKDKGEGYEGSHGLTALIDAVKEENAEIVKLLLDFGADVNAEGSVFGDTAIGWAIHKNNVEIAKLLLTAGANPNTISRIPHVFREGAVLYQATQEGRAEIVQLLLNAGADVNGQDNYDGRTALMEAVRGNKQLVKMLLEAGADANAQDDNGDTVFSYAGAEDKKIRELLRAAKKDTLREACKRLDVKAVESLIKSGADVNALEKYRAFVAWADDYSITNLHGRSPLHIMLNVVKPETQEERAKQQKIIELLKAAGAKDIDVNMEAKRYEGVVPVPSTGAR